MTHRQLSLINDKLVEADDPLKELHAALGRPVYTSRSKFRTEVIWGKLGGTSLKISYDILNDLWAIYFQIFTDDQTYRKNLIDVDFEIAQSWLVFNTQFIITNIRK